MLSNSSLYYTYCVYIYIFILHLLQHRVQAVQGMLWEAYLISLFSDSIASFVSDLSLDKLILLICSYDNLFLL